VNENEEMKKPFTMYLDSVRLDHSILGSSFESGLQPLEFYQRQFKATVSRCEVSSSLYWPVQSAWIRVLNETRYSVERARELPALEFGASDALDLYGQTATPPDRMSGHLADLFQIGQRLIKIGESKPEERPKLIEQCIDAANKLVKSPKDKYEQFEYKGVLSY
jgi:hypothetical protein